MKYKKDWFKVLVWFLALFFSLTAEEEKKEPSKETTPPPRVVSSTTIFNIYWLGKMNTNKDSKVTFEEFSRYFQEHFQKADTNKNGVMEKTEYEKFMKDLKQTHLDNSIKTLENLDKDKDGRLSREEAKVDEKRFSELDSDKNDYISKEEIKNAAEKNWIAYFNAYMHYFPYSFSQMDANHDDKVNPKELETAIESLFSWFDLNGDRMISGVDAELQRTRNSPKQPEKKRPEGSPSSP